MPDSKPNANHLDAGAPRVFDVEALLAPHPPRTNLNLHHVDGAFTIRIARLHDAFPWHDHEGAEEAWVVLRGGVRFRSELGDVEAHAGQLTVIPAHLRHSPMALESDTTVVVIHRRGMSTAYADPGMSDTAAGYHERELGTNKP